MDYGQRLKRLGNVGTLLLDYTSRHNINTFRVDYDCCVKREEASCRHKLIYEFYYAFA